MTPTQLWQRYLRRHPEAADALVSSYYFGDTKEEANQAVTRICLGEKTGCVSFPRPLKLRALPAHSPGTTPSSRILPVTGSALFRFCGWKS